MFCAAWLLSARKCALFVVVVFGHMFRHLHVSWVFERHGLRVLHNGLLCEPCATRCTAMQGLSLSHVHGADGRTITGRPETPCKGPTSIFEFVFLVCVLLLYVCPFSPLPVAATSMAGSSKYVLCVGKVDDHFECGTVQARTGMLRRLRSPVNAHLPGSP